MLAEAGGTANCAFQSSSMRGRIIVSAASICSWKLGNTSEGGAPPPDCGAETGAPQRGQVVLPAGKIRPHCPQCCSNVLDIAGFCLSSTRV